MRQLIGLILVLVLGACSSAATSAPSPAAGGSAAPSSALSSAPSSAATGAAQSTAPAVGNSLLPADPCATLTLEELQQVTGQAFQPGVKSVTANTAECVWTQQNGNGVVTVHFVKLDFGVFDLNGKSPANVAVPGVGDQAFLLPIINSIDVAKGNLEFTVQPVLFGNLDWKKIATDLAKLVAGRVTG